MVVTCLYHSQMRLLWMQSSWTCTKTVMESSWCLTSPSSGKTHVSEHLHYSWTDELSVCRFPLGVVSIVAPLHWTLPVSSLCCLYLKRGTVSGRSSVKFAIHFSDKLTHIWSFLLFIFENSTKKNSVYLCNYSNKNFDISWKCSVVLVLIKIIIHVQNRFLIVILTRWNF